MSSDCGRLPYDTKARQKCCSKDHGGSVKHVRSHQPFDSFSCPQCIGMKLIRRIKTSSKLWANSPGGLRSIKSFDSKFVSSSISRRISWNVSSSAADSRLSLPVLQRAYVCIVCRHASYIRRLSPCPTQMLHTDCCLGSTLFIQNKIKSEVKWSGEKFCRAVKGFIILEISLEMISVLCLV